MGTYGTYTGVVRWYDYVNAVGHMLVLKDGDVQTDITGDYWASGATGYNVGEGFWLDKSPITRTAGSPVGLLLALTHATSGTTLGKTRVFIGNADGSKLLWDGTDLIITGTVYATAGEFTGTVNWGSGYGQLNATGLEWEKDANNFVRLDDSSAVGFLRIKQSASSSDGVYVQQAGTAGSGIVTAVTNSGNSGSALSASHAGNGNAIRAASNGTSGYAILASSAATNAGVAVISAQASSGCIGLEAVMGSVSQVGLNCDGSAIITGALTMTEMTEPSAPSTNKGILYLKDNGSGKTQLCVRFNSGAVQVLATQP